jgi:hypothetical protein
MPSAPKNRNLPDDDFAAGFRVGWEAIHGDTGSGPVLTPKPPAVLVLGFTKFTMGVRMEVQAALGIDNIHDILKRSGK